MLFHRCQYTQIGLHPPGVVIADEARNHLYELPLAGEASAVIALPFQNAPESLHRAVVNAVSHTGHALRHSGLYKFVMEYSACVLEASVVVEQRMGIRVGLNSFVKSLEYKGIVIALT